MEAKVLVELDIYSGMPNPRWQLSRGDALTFENQLAAAREPAKRDLLSGLGYRGFIVEVEQGGETSVIHVQSGVIHVSMHGADTKYLDRDRVFERWLLETGRQYLPVDVLADAEKALQTP